MPGCSEEMLQEFQSTAILVRPRFQRIATRWLHNHEDAEDAVQVALLTGLRHLDQFQGRARLATWLHTILLNTLRMRLRSSRRVQHDPVEDYVLRDFRPTPEQTIVKHEEYGRLDVAVASLPKDQRIAVLLHYEHGYMIHEIAAFLGKPEGTVKARLARARRFLRKKVL
jgi:RNA polymerase sigma-70 factor, ECF subfamily